MTGYSDAIAHFAAAIGPSDPVVVVGGDTHGEVGGSPDPAARRVRAPNGVVEFLPAEMTVRVNAGTPVADLREHLAEAGQTVALPTHAGGSVGGALAVGRGGVDRLGQGPPRDAVLQIAYVAADGSVVTAGGPTVKNVSGFDLCRLLVGSLGTLGCLAEVVMRTVPLPAAALWVAGVADPAEVVAALHRPRSILWDGQRVWAHVAGEANHVATQTERAAAVGLTDEVPGPPDLPPHRWSTRPAALGALQDRPHTFVAEWGVGIVHDDQPAGPRELPAATHLLHRRIKTAFDPTGRLNPGRVPEGLGSWT